MPKLSDSFIHLGRGAKATPQPPFFGNDWYETYAHRTGGDGVEGRLVSFHRFSESWTYWEMHPHGDEVVICISGSLTLHQEHEDGSKDILSIGPGEYAINPPGTWHTADIDGEASAIFITAGLDTEERERIVAT